MGALENSFQDGFGKIIGLMAEKDGLINDFFVQRAEKCKRCSRASSSVVFFSSRVV